MAAAAICCGSWRLLCVGLGMFAVCRRLLINRFRLIVFSTNVRASGTPKFGYEGILKILPRNAHGTYKVACTKCSCMVLSLYNAACREDYVRVEFNARYEKKTKPMIGFKDKLDTASQ